MREQHIKRFALFFSLLLILQECHSLPTSPFDEFEFSDDGNEDYLKVPEVVNIGRQGVPTIDTTGFSADTGNEEKSDEVKIDGIDNAKKADEKVNTAKDQKKNANEITAKSSELPSRPKRFLGLSLTLLSAISAGWDIYKFVAGCDDIAKNLKSNAIEGEKLEAKFLSKRKQLNQDWAVIDGRERYLQRLSTELTIMQPLIARMDSLQIDIIKLLDADVLNKIDRQKRVIENALDRANETSELNPELLNAKAYSAGSFALTLSLKLVPLLLWFGASFVPSYLSNRAKYLEKALFDNPDRKWKNRDFKIMKTVVRGRQFKISVANKWNGWVKKLPASMKRVSNKLTVNLKSSFDQAEEVTKKMSKTKVIASVIVIGLFAAYEIWAGVKFAQDCKKREKESFKMIATLQESLKNISYAENNMTDIRAKIKTGYDDMFSYIKTYKFGAFVKEAIKTARGAEIQTKSLTNSAKDMELFYLNINSTWRPDGFIDYKRVEKYVVTLNRGFQKQTHKLTCYRKKMAIIRKITQECAAGEGTFEKLWNTSKAMEARTLQNCIENDNYLTQAGINNVINSFMETMGKHKKCIRNDKNKKDFVCGKWLDDKTNEEIAPLVDGLTVDDVAFFVSTCPLGDVTPIMVGTICNFKEDKTKDINSVYNKFPKYKKPGLLAQWNSCPLGDLQRKSICNSKANLYSFAQIRAEFKNFKVSLIKAVYDNCVIEMNADTKETACSTYWLSGQDVNSEYMTNFYKIYTRAVVVAYVTSSACKKPDWLS